jgi:uncharacterized protein (TIGR02996 family)
MARRRKQVENEGFLEAILADPEDDALRLIYADWLDEHGDPERAEFIRVQIELARLPPTDPCVSELRAREGRLFIPNRQRWGFPGKHRPHFRRGFLDEWEYGWPPDEAFRQAPIQTIWHAVDPYWGEDGVDEAHPYPVDSPYLSRIRTAHLPAGRSSSIPVETLILFTASPHLTDLRSLDVSGNPLCDAGFEELIGREPTSASRTSTRPTPLGLRQLETLNVSETDLGNVALKALTESSLARTLTRLDLSENGRITSSGLDRLLRSDLGSRLRELSLALPSNSRRSLASVLVKALPRLRLRRLRACGVFNTVDAVEALANAPSWGPLEALDLSYTSLSGAAFKTLMGCPHLAGISTLYLDLCALKDADMQPLARCRHLKNLTHLSLVSNPIGDAGARAIAESTHLRQLVYLNLATSGSALGDAGLKALTESPVLSSVYLLNLQGSMYCQFGDDSLRALATSTYAARLTTLRIGPTEAATDAAAVALAESANLPCLTYLDLRTPQMTSRGLQSLLQARRIAWLALRWPIKWRLPAKVPASENHRIGPASLGSDFGDTDIRWSEPFFEWWDQCFFF